MLLFVLGQIAFCIGIISEKYWFDIVFFFFVLEYYWKSIGLLLFYGILLEKYWFNIALFFFFVWNTIGKVLVYYGFIFLFVLEKYWISIVLCCWYVKGASQT